MKRNLFIKIMQHGNFFYKILIAVSAHFLFLVSVAQKQNDKISFTVSMDHPETKKFQIEMQCRNKESKALQLKLPVWSPGYYQKMDYAANVGNFHVTDGSGKELKWQKTADNIWQLSGEGTAILNISYEVTATRQFVASSFLDTSRGYIIPAAAFMHIGDQIQQPVEVTIKPYAKWKDVATGLDPVAGRPYTYTAPDFDILYDSPFLIGNLESLPSFTVKGIPHYFIGYKLGEFDRVAFMNDLKKIVESASGLIGDIPYRHYTFIAIGPGAGGIEHLNSTTISFSGSGMNTREGRIRMLSFIAHEYFHHYNVKRIRPIELGPFDYDNGSRTRMLWVSEGLTVYYEYMVLKRAGLITTEELLNLLRSNIIAHERKPGRFFQSLVQASYETWSDGPFGRTGDEVNKTISYYDKGPVVGLLLDFAVRHESKNKSSLDDVMRTLYKDYYQKKKRGFTEEEFRAVCEKMAGKTLPEIFEYTTTVQPLNYPKYFAYAGLAIDTTAHEVEGAYLGALVQQRAGATTIGMIDAGSPAANGGLRTGDQVVELDGSAVDSKAFNALLQSKKPGDRIKILTSRDQVRNEREIILGKKFEKNFSITYLPNPTPLQKQVLEDWSK